MEKSESGDMYQGWILDDGSVASKLKPGMFINY